MGLPKELDFTKAAREFVDRVPDPGPYTHEVLAFANEIAARTLEWVDLEFNRRYAGKSGQPHLGYSACIALAILDLRPPKESGNG